MKKGWFKILMVGILSLITLSSCDFYEIINELLNNIYPTGSVSYTDNGFRLVSTPEENITIVRDDETLSGHSITLKDVKDGEGYEVFPSIGDNNLLVIPVYFSDYPVEQCIGDKVVAKENIEKAFFGGTQDTGWESVSSYYNKSSYGNLNITGLVTDWCPLNKTLIDVAMNTQYDDPSIYCLETAVKWFKTNYPDEVTNFDLDSDGYIDSIVLVYANDAYSNTTARDYTRKYTSKELSYVKNFLWAYTFWNYKVKANKYSPEGNAYTWLSYSFLWEGGYYEQTGSYFGSKNKLVDCHTYIHEFGHLLGLEDYYSYDDNDFSPAGRLDMMDYNIGDHSPFSKYCLGWIEPTIVDHVGTYTINKFTSDGSALLIPADLDRFSYSAFDEYLLIDLYSPDELNKLDSTNQYCGSTSQYPKLFSKLGVRIFHVDSRLAVLNQQNKQFYYTHKNNDLSLNRHSIQQTAHSNTPSYSLDPYNRLLTLLSSQTDAMFKNKAASNADLFDKGDVFSSFGFNNGKELQYEITIDSIDSLTGTCQITVSKKGE